MRATEHPIVNRYLRDLERALRDVPTARRREIVDEIREHIHEATSEGLDERRVRDVLDELGDPETIADEARARFGITPSRAGFLEGVTIALLLVGGIVVPALGWLVGVVLLWVSRVWTTKDKMIGTFLLPGGLAFPLFLLILAPAGSSGCTGVTDVNGSVSFTRLECTNETSFLPSPWAIALLILLTVIPIATAVYLGRRAFRA